MHHFSLIQEIKLEESEIVKSQKANKEALDLVKQQLFSSKNESSLESYCSIDPDFDFEKEEKDLIDEYHQEKIFDTTRLVKVLYHYVKSRIDIRELIQKIMGDSDQEFPFTRQIFLQYILNNCAVDLRIRILQTLCQYSPIPLKRKFISSLQEEGGSYNEGEIDQPKVKVYTEIGTVYEGMKSVLNFNIGQRVKLQETFINMLLMKNFEELNERKTNQDMLEIQFDYNMQDPQYIPAANYLGEMALPALKQLTRIFNIFIIHIEQIMITEQTQLQKAIKEIDMNSSEERKFLVLILEQNERQKGFLKDETEIKTKFPGLSNNIQLVRFIFPSSMQNDNFKNMVFSARKLVLEFDFEKVKDYSSDPMLRIKTIENFMKVTDETDPNYNNVQKCIESSKKLINKIYQNSNDLHSSKFLPMNGLYSQLCSLERDKEEVKVSYANRRFNQEDSMKENILNKLKEQVPTELIKDLQCFVSEYQYSGAIIFIFQKIIGGFLETKKEIINEQRIEIQQNIEESEVYEAGYVRASSEQQKMEQDQKKDILAIQLKQVKDELRKISFSYEYLVREFYLFSTYYKDNDQRMQLMEQFRHIQNYMLTSSHPVEIIDGNNLTFITNVFDQIRDVQDENDQVFVVSIIGPQSAGKSLISNFLFGSLLKSSDGRCTKGIYGVIFNVKTEDGSKKKLIVLDTEGIQSQEQRDETFDRRIVFYTLCISNLVIICNKGDMNSQMAEVIKLAADTTSKLKEKIVHADVLIVMNLLKSLDNKAQYESIQKLKMAIAYIDVAQEERARKIFQINNNTVVLLPDAFQNEENGKFILYKPLSSFSFRIQSLKQKILSYMKNHFEQQGDTYRYSSKEWFLYAEKMWSFSELQGGFREYTDLDQKRLNLKLRKFLKSLIQDYIEDYTNESKDCNREDETQMGHPGSKIVQDVASQINQELQKYIGKKDLTFQHIYGFIENKIVNNIIEPHNKLVNTKYNEFCYSNEKILFSTHKEGYATLLYKQLSFQKINLLTMLRNSVIHFMKQQNKINGFDRMNKVLEEIQDQQIKLSEEEALQAAENAWKEIIITAEEQIRKKDEIEEDVFTHIFLGYELHLPQNCFKPDQQIENAIMQQYRENGNAIFQLYFEEDLKENLLFWDGHERYPNPGKFFGSLQMKKDYLRNLPLYIFQENLDKEFAIFYWILFLQERLNVSKIAKELAQVYCNLSVKNNFQSSLKSQNEKFQEELKLIQNDLEDELSIFYLGIRNLFFEKINYELFESKSQNLVSIKNQNKLADHLEQMIISMISGEQVNQYFKVKEMENFLNFRYQRDDKSIQYFLTSSTNKFSQRKNIGNLDMSQYVKEQKMYSQNDQYDGAAIFFLDQNNQNFKLQVDQDLDNKDLLRYFNYLSSNMKGKVSQQTLKRPIIEAKKFLCEQQINYESIISNIESIVLSQIYKKYQSSEKLKIQDIIKDIQKEQSKYKIEDFVKIENKCISKIAQEVQSFITMINEELSRFVFKLSDKGEAFLHQIARILLSSISIVIQQQNERESIIHLHKEKDHQIQLFCAKVTSNDEILDTTNSKRVADQIQKYLGEKNIEGYNHQFREYIQSIQQQYSKKLIFQDLENLAYESAQSQEPIKSFQSYDFQMNLEKIATYYIEKKLSKGQQFLDSKIVFIIQLFTDPKTFFEILFQTLWEKYAQEKVKSYHKSYLSNVKSELSKVIDFFNQLKNDLKQKGSNKPSNILFIKEVSQENSDKCDEIQISKGGDQLYKLHNKCASVYLQLLILNKVNKQNQNLRIEPGTGIFIKKIQDIDFLLGSSNFLLPDSDQVSNNFSQDLRDQIIQVIEKEGISNLEIFLDNVIENLKSEEKFLDLEAFENLVVDNQKIDFKNSFSGCYEYCPLCRYQCDVEHSVTEALQNRSHQCSNGHRIQGFGGNKLQNSRASTKICSDLDNDAEVVYQGKIYKWKEFTKLDKLKNWNFFQKDSEKEENKRKYRLIWNHFGKLICQKYQTDDKIDIKFQPSSDRVIDKIHYVLVLDQSTSMRGQRLDSLKKSVQDFLRSLNENELIQKNSRVSIITYSNIAREKALYQAPYIELADLIQQEGLGTNFKLALKMAHETILKISKEESCDKHSICMLSDGEADYPYEEVKQLLADTNTFRSISFKALLFGHSKGGEQVLRKLCIDLQGEFSNVLDVDQLRDQFKQLIPNIYSS